VVYMATTHTVHDILQRSASAGVRVDVQRVHAHHCRLGLKETYACVAEVAARMHASDRPQRGVLYFHFDLWLQPWRILTVGDPPSVSTPAVETSSLPPSANRRLSMLWALPRERILLKKGGPTQLLPLHCFNASYPPSFKLAYPHWTWDRDLPPAHAGLHRACAHGSCDPDRLCIGWADLYYIPSQLTRRFSALSRAFVASMANAELAVPTMIDMLTSELALEAPQAAASRAPPGEPLHRGRARHAAASVFRPACWGFCCAQTTCPELLARYPCGHRMQLSEPAIREAFQSLMQVPETADAVATGESTQSQTVSSHVS
jgi:hypothetical protein